MKVVALAGGIGAGKFLRGVARIVSGDELTVILNVADDVVVHGLHVSPDPDSVTYWLAGVADRERGWGRAGETFRATEELRRLDAKGSWFGLGDLDLATHLLRTSWLRGGHTLSEVTAELYRRLGVVARVIPMTEEPAPTGILVLGDGGRDAYVHFQEYWVERR